MPELNPVTIIIPARYGSSRFPGKPLAPLMGKPLIQHVYERARSAARVKAVLVATDDQRIVKAVEGFGGKAVLTSESFRTGTDRVAAMARQLPGDVFLDLQADEIPLDPALISDLIVPFLGADAGMGTLKRKLSSTDDLLNPAVVKVVTDRNDHALYFSRAPIPLVRDAAPGSLDPRLHFVHLGLYIYTRATLEVLTSLPTGRIEEAEKLEQLRALEHGIPITVWETEQPSLRIDTPEDLTHAAAILQRPEAVCRRG
jgi:3-deoxy-manno-octulosonate cytidylyltransferase (CMP-KDO synthetase)